MRARRSHRGSSHAEPRPRENVHETPRPPIAYPARTMCCLLPIGAMPHGVIGCFAGANILAWPFPDSSLPYCTWKGQLALAGMGPRRGFL